MTDRIREGLEGLVHAVACLRRCEEMRGAVDRAHPGELFLADDAPLQEVHLVSEEDDRDVPDLFADHLDPVVEIVERVLARQIADRDDAMRAFEVRVPEEGPETFLAHDVPHHHVEHRGRTPPFHFDGLLRDLRPDRRDVPVIEFVLDEPPDERGLPDRDIPDQTHLGLDVLQAGHRGRRHHAARNGLLLRYRVDAILVDDDYYSSEPQFRPERHFATRSARDWKAVSTLTPAFADVKWNGLS